MSRDIGPGCPETRHCPWRHRECLAAFGRYRVPTVDAARGPEPGFVEWWARSCRSAGVGAKAARTASRRSGTTRYQAHLPRFCRVSSPASTKVDRWCDTVGWERPTGSTRSQAHASPASAAATIDSRRKRAGSASTLNTAASSAAWSSAAPPRSPAHSTRRTAGSSRHLQAIPVTHVLTLIDATLEWLPWRLDRRRRSDGNGSCSPIRCATASRPAPLWGKGERLSGQTGTKALGS